MWLSASRASRLLPVVEPGMDVEEFGNENEESLTVVEAGEVLEVIIRKNDQKYLSAYLK